LSQAGLLTKYIQSKAKNWKSMTSKISCHCTFKGTQAWDFTLHFFGIISLLGCCRSSVSSVANILFTQFLGNGVFMLYPLTRSAPWDSRPLSGQRSMTVTHCSGLCRVIVVRCPSWCWMIFFSFNFHTKALSVHHSPDRLVVTEWALKKTFLHNLKRYSLEESF